MLAQVAFHCCLHCEWLCGNGSTPTLEICQLHTQGVKLVCGDGISPSGGGLVSGRCSCRWAWRYLRLLLLLLLLLPLLTAVRRCGSCV